MPDEIPQQEQPAAPEPAVESTIRVDWKMPAARWPKDRRGEKKVRHRRKRKPGQKSNWELDMGDSPDAEYLKNLYTTGQKLRRIERAQRKISRITMMVDDKDVLPHLGEIVKMFVDEGKPLSQAILKFFPMLNDDQVRMLERRKMLREAIRKRRAEGYAATNPLLTKKALVGQLYELSMSLNAQGKKDKAADILAVIMRAQGFIPRSVAAKEEDPLAQLGLTQREIDDLKKEAKRQDAERDEDDG